MTTDTPDNPPSGTVEQAMNRVLEAEREAQQAVEACRHDALQIRQAAQLQAGRIARRTDERLAHCHTRCNALLAREIREGDRAAAANPAGEASYRLDDDALAAVVETLALTLAGLTPAGPRSGEE